MISKLQQGGGFPPYVSYTNIPQSQPTAPYTTNNKSVQETQNNEMLNDNVKSLLYKQGIPSDVNALIERIGLFKNSLFNNLDTNNSSMQYKVLLTTLPKIRWENDRLEQAMKQAEANSSLGEIAVTEHGYVITTDKDGNLSKKKLDDVNFDTERMLTNNELFEFRLNNPKAAFNTDITNIISNGVGIPKIQEYLKSVVDKLGTSTYNREGYANKEQLQILQGIKELKDSEGVYSFTKEITSQSKQAKMAVNYLLATLPKNMLTVLQANAAQRLGDNSINGVKSMLEILVGSTINDSDIFKIKYDSNLSKPDSTGKSGTKAGVDLKSPEALLLGMGESKMYPINMGTADTMNVRGNASLIVDKDGNSIAKGTLQDVIGGQLGSTLDWDNISMGGNMINPVQSNKIALNGNKIIAADLPLDQQALRRGEIKPDLDMLLRKEKADQYIREHNIKDKNQINQIYASKEYNLPIMYDSNGQLILTNYKRFGIISGFADAKAFGSDVEDLEENNLLKQVDDDNLMESIIQTLTAADKDFTSSQGWLDSNTYLGSIFIPMTDSVLMTSLGSKNYYPLPNKTADEVYKQQQLEEKRLGYVKPESFSKV